MKNEHAIGNEINGKKDILIINIDPKKLLFLEIAELLKILENIAVCNHSSTFSLLYHDGGYKVILTTTGPGLEEQSKRIDETPFHDKAKDALIYAIIRYGFQDVQD